jgi:hypothetical protein
VSNTIESARIQKNNLYQAKEDSYNTLTKWGNELFKLKSELKSLEFERNQAKNAMNVAYKENQSAWAKYKEQQADLSIEIEDAKREGNIAHRKMSANFDEANDAYSSGDGASAKYYSNLGHEYEDELSSLNARVQRLIQKAKSKEKPSEKEYRELKVIYEEKRDKYTVKQSEINAIQIKHEEAKSIFRKELEAYKEAEAIFDELNKYGGKELPPNIKRLIDDKLVAFHSSSQEIQSGSKKSGDYVTVRTDWNKEHGEICTNIIIRSKESPGYHYHFVIGESGTVYIDELRNDHK